MAEDKTTINYLRRIHALETKIADAHTLHLKWQEVVNKFDDIAKASSGLTPIEDQRDLLSVIKTWSDRAREMTDTAKKDEQTLLNELKFMRAAYYEEEIDEEVPGVAGSDPALDQMGVKK